MVNTNLYKVKEVADIIGCSVWCTYEHIRRKKLNVFYIGTNRKRMLISEESVNEFIRNMKETKEEI